MTARVAGWASLLLYVVIPVLAAAQSLEFQVRAAFLLNFTKFIDWPAESASSATFDICIDGEDPFGKALDDIVSGETLQGRPITVQRVRHLIPAACRIVYFGRPVETAGVSLESLAPGVLTVGEGDAFLREGGMVAFVLESNRVRFDINQSAALKAHLMLSSRLLNVARKVMR